MRTAAALLAACGLFVCATPAQAVDRSLGSDVPKPVASGAPWTDPQIAALDANVELALAGSRALRGAHVGVYAVDARDGRVLYERNPDDLFQPASTLKLVVASAALEKLGPEFRFHTDAVAGGPVVDGTLAGALIVRAGGDPFLTAADFDALAQSVAAKGIRRLRDGVRFDISRYEGPGYLPGWNWDDLPFGYAAAVSALAFEGNAVHLTVTPGSVVDGPASVTSAPLSVVHRPIEGCTFGTAPLVEASVTTTASGTKDTVDLKRSAFGCTAVTGAIPFGSAPDTFDGAVPFPTVYAALALRAALERAGVTAGQLTMVAPPDLFMSTSVPPAAPVLWSHDSEPLRDMVADIWGPSNNLAAEMLLRELSVAGGTTPGTTRAGIAAETAWLTGLGVDTSVIALEDGSGMSAYDRITPRALVTVLKRDWNGPLHDVVLDDLPIAGVRGTLRTQYTGTVLEKHVFAKTGTLSRAGALAGYAGSQKHGAVIFAIVVDSFAGDPQALGDVRARVLASPDRGLMLGARFEAEIREQPAVWRRIAASDAAARFADAVRGRSLLFVGNGSSLFIGMLAALAFRRRGIRARALAASEARFDHAADTDAYVVALSQSGRSTDILAALDVLSPVGLIALTNDITSPLAQRATLVVDCLAGPEVAVPASKSVTAMGAILLWAASITGRAKNRNGAALDAVAARVDDWLRGDRSDMRAAAAQLADRRTIAVAGAGYGVPVAHELALKIKEASYVHAEGFAAGEFRHGSSAMLDASSAIIGIVDDASRDTVARPLAEAAHVAARRYVIGADADDATRLGPPVDDPFNTLAWLATGQTLALELGRARGVDSDAPRGLRKFV